MPGPVISATLSRLSSGSEELTGQQISIAVHWNKVWSGPASTTGGALKSTVMTIVSSTAAPQESIANAMN